MKRRVVFCGQWVKNVVVPWAAVDRQLVSMADLCQEVLQEHERQIARWGVQSHTPAEWIMILAEEVGELAQAAWRAERPKGSPERVRREAIHVATLALKIAEMYETTAL